MGPFQDINYIIQFSEMALIFFNAYNCYFFLFFEYISDPPLASALRESSFLFLLGWLSSLAAHH